MQKTPPKPRFWISKRARTFSVDRKGSPETLVSGALLVPFPAGEMVPVRDMDKPLRPLSHIKILPPRQQPSKEVLFYDLSRSRGDHAGARRRGGRHVRRAAPSVRQPLRPVSLRARERRAGGPLPRRRGARARLPPGAAVFHLLRHRVRQLGHLRGRVAGPPRRAAHHHHRP